MKFVVETIINLYQGFLIIYFFRNLFPGDDNTIPAIMCTVGAGVFLCLHEYFTWPFTDSIVFFAGFIYMTITHRGSWGWRILGCVLIATLWTACISIVNASVLFLFNIDNTALQAMNFTSRLLYVVTCNAFVSFATFVVVRIIREREYVRLIRSASVLFAVLLFSEWFATELTFTFVLNSMKNDISAILLCIFMLMMILMTMLIYDFLCKTVAHSFEVENNARMLEEARQHQGDLQIIYQSMLSAQHDMKHKIATIEAMMNEGESQDRTAIQEIMKESNGLKVFMTGDEMVDATLAVKKAGMDQLEIEFRYQAYPLQSLPMDSVSFCVLISNLLDNAIHETDRLPSSRKTERIIEFGFARSMDMFHVFCSNPTVNEKVDISEQNLASKKMLGHGYGLESIRTAIKKHNGRCDTKTGNYRFETSITIPMEDSTDVDKCE